MTQPEQSGSQRRPPTVTTPWGRRPKFCPTCESELRWFGDWSAACACTGGADRIEEEDYRS